MSRREKIFKPLEVEVREGESIERAIKRFTKKVKKEGVLEIVRERQYYIKPSYKKYREKLRQHDRFRKIQIEEQERNKE